MVLDGYLLGVGVVETARLMGAVGEIEPIVIAAVSPQGGFHVGNTRRLRDFSANADNDMYSSNPIIQSFKPGFEASGLTLDEALGGSDQFRKFLADELLPRLQSMYSIDIDRLGIIGHSAGGSFLIEALLEGDTPFADYIIGEAGSFLLFGTGPALVAQAAAKDSLPAKRAFYADSSDTWKAAPTMLQQSLDLITQIGDPVGVPVETITYQGETHTTMIPGFIKDGLLYMYGTGTKYSDRVLPSEDG